jgi:anti-sigma factor RsiW
MQCAEYRDLVAADVDGQLSDEEAVLARVHVDRCANCARLLETQRALKGAFRARRWVQPVPDGVRQTIIGRIEAADRAQRQAGTQRAWWALPVTRLVLAGVAALLILTVAVPLLRLRLQPREVAPFDTIADHYRAVRSGQVALTVRTDDPMALRAYYLKTGAFSFRNTVVDLEPLGFVLDGGSVTELAGRKSTLSVYRGPGGIVLCHRIEATSVELPPGGDVVGGDHIYTVGGITISVHREGDIFCFMASDMPRADFLRLLVGHV